MLFVNYTDRVVQEMLKIWKIYDNPLTWEREREREREREIHTAAITTSKSKISKKITPTSHVSKINWLLKKLSFQRTVSLWINPFETRRLMNFSAVQILKCIHVGWSNIWFKTVFLCIQSVCLNELLFFLFLRNCLLVLSYCKFKIHNMTVFRYIFRSVF